MEQMQGLDIVRAVSAPVRALAVDGVMPLMEVRFSPFDVWYEIDSYWEGTFLECTKRGAYVKTMKERRDQIKSLYDHGWDPQIGNKVLGTIEDLREDPDSAVGDVRLFDTGYVRELLPGLEAGVYGSSMRMRVIKDEWNDDPGVSEHNPRGIPERTILEVRLDEFGPVTWPANHQATAGVRSLTDQFYERLRSREPERVAELMRARETRTPEEPAAGAATASDEGAAPTPDEPGAAHSEEHRTPRRGDAYPFLNVKE